MIYYEQNIEGKDFVVGDLHGEYTLLMQKLHDIGFDKSVDRLFSVGDLVDRGPYSLKCLKLIKEDWFIPVLGNHEAMMLDSVLHRTGTYHWEINGGEWHNDCDPTELYDICQEYVDKLPKSITVKTKNGDIGICHAEPPSDDWRDNIENLSMIWGRDCIHWKNPQVKGVYKTVHGHTPAKQIIRTGNLVFIDTGAFYTGNLTVIPLEEI